MERNREGYLVGETERECTNCGSVFNITSKMTLCKECNCNRVKSYSPEYKLWLRAKQRSKTSGRVFNIDKEDIVIPERCPILDVPLVVHKGKSGAYQDSPSLDRIDNSRGYEKGNIQVISQLANSMKGAASNQQLRKFATWILSNVPADD